MLVPESQQELKPYIIIKTDGTKETVYIMEDPIEKTISFRDCLTIAYVMVGTVALALTAYIGYLQLKHSKNGR